MRQGLRKLGWGTAFLLASLPMTAGAAQAADYVVLNFTKTIDRPADVVWSKVGGYCSAIRVWMKVDCEITSGVESGDKLMGSVRRLSGSPNLPAPVVVEVVVATTRWSYTYTQPDTTNLYHGTLGVEPIGDGSKSELSIRVFWDKDLMTPEQHENAVTRRTRVFNDALSTMKEMAEAP